MIAEPGSRAGLRRVLVVLCATEITSWGVLYYAFPVLAPSISASTGWSLTQLMFGFSVGQFVAAAVGVLIGRWIDRFGPRLIMTTASLLGVAAVAATAAMRSPFWFFVACVVAGVAKAGVLYQPAFAALTRWYGSGRVAALTTLTLVGGLASTVFAPVTAVLNAQLGWRQTYVVLAVVLGVVTIPLHAWGLRLSWPAADHREAESPSVVARSRAFVMLMVAMTLAAFAAYAVVVNLVPLLNERGMSTTAAAWALGLGGVGQVLGRLGYGKLSRHTTVRTRTALVLTTSAATTVVLGLVPGPAVLLVVGAVLAGVARGVFTLVQATAVTDRWGPVHYGRLSGLIGVPVTFAAAVAPWAGSAMASWFGGYAPGFLVLSAVGLVAAVLSLRST